MSEWDTTALLSDIKERASLPDNDVRFTNALLLSAATKELREGIAPLLSNARSEHLVYPYSQAVTAGLATYRMPPRAVGGVLRDVAFIDESERAVRLRQLSADEIELIGRTDNQGTPYAYWLQGYKVVLVGEPNVAGTLSTPYYARPNKLILPTAASSTEAVILVSSVTYNATLDTLTLVYQGVPAAVMQVDGVSLDVVRATPGFETLATGAFAVTETDPGAEWTFVLSGVEEDPGVVSGDYLCLAGQAPVPQAPVELHGLLAVRTARRLLKAVGDDRWQALEADVADLEQKATTWLSPRVSGDTQQAGGSIGSSGLVAGMGWAFGWY